MFLFILYAEFKNILIKIFKFGHKEVAAKDFYRQRQITDTFTIDGNKIVLSDKVSSDNWKDRHYIVTIKSMEH